MSFFFFFQAEDGIRDADVTGVQTCALPISRDHEQVPLDPVGAALSTIGIVALVYGLIEAPSRGWLAGATLGSFAVAIAVLGAFVTWELRVEHPTLDIR